MKSVKFNETTIIIKNSKFITLIIPLYTLEEISFNLEKAHLKYKDATHYCYAYIFDNNRKACDDGEPSGTAGIPILQVLEKNNLNHVLCIVIRYFGKIKLGKGGLIRAYTKSVTLSLENHIINLKKNFSVKITFNYDIIKKVDYLLKDVYIKNKIFDNKITYIIYIDTNTINELKNLPNISLEILGNIYI